MIERFLGSVANRLRVKSNLDDVDDRQAALDNLTDVVSATDNQVLMRDAATGKAKFKTNSGVGMSDAFQVHIPLSVGKQVLFIAPFSLNIHEWTIRLDISGSAAVDVWLAESGELPDSGDSIFTPTVVSGYDNSVSGLDVDIDFSKYITFNVDSAATATEAVVVLHGTRV